MEPADDVTGEMRVLPLDAATADALLEGRIGPDDAPPGYREVASAVRSARSGASVAELAGEEQVVAAMVAAAAGSLRTSPLSPMRRRPMIAKLMSAKVAAVATGFVLVGGGVAAAATGSLPSGVQHSVADAAAHVGVSIPGKGSGAHQATTSGTTGSTNATTGSANAVGPKSGGPETYGLCTAYAASHRSSTSTSGSTAASQTTTTSGSTNTSVAFANLLQAANAKGESVSAYCKSFVRPGKAHSAGSKASSSAGAGVGNRPTGAGTTAGTRGSGAAGSHTGASAAATHGASVYSGPSASQVSGSASNGSSRSDTSPGAAGNGSAPGTADAHGLSAASSGAGNASSSAGGAGASGSHRGA
ncbi:MAG: hypothetical protein M0Z82_12755 [Actinomycetota bacterium]|nr:hypothetical protein [Actinomycetota bacterium]